MKHIELTTEQERVIEERMLTGAYRNEREVIDDALARLVEDELEGEVGVEAVSAAIERGAEELRAGRGIPVTDREEFIRGVMSRAKSRSKTATAKRRGDASR
ncbi:hypothetical protein CMK11_03140 [Candidatus Poribacteria bacterium]|nr:hypothetical protein [Candidatus Poribacteria bacterium]